jgi:hypothetical protein
MPAKFSRWDLLPNLGVVDRIVPVNCRENSVWCPPNPVVVSTEPILVVMLASQLGYRPPGSVLQFNHQPQTDHPRGCSLSGFNGCHFGASSKMSAIS